MLNGVYSLGVLVPAGSTLLRCASILLLADRKDGDLCSGKVTFFVCFCLVLSFETVFVLFKLVLS